MKRWPIKPLGELVDFVGGGTPRRDRPDYWGGEVPWASVKDLQSQSLETTIETITAKGLASSASNLIPKGTVIIASRVGLGKVAINLKPVAINQDLKALTPRSNDLSPRYLLLFLLSKAEYFERTGVGATVKGLTLADYQKLDIVLPPLTQQGRIVKLPNEADELRKLRARADRRTAALIPALFHEMFGDPAANDRKWKREIFSNLLDGIDGGWSPTCHDRPVEADEWGVLKLGAVTTCKYIDTENKALPDSFTPHPELEVKVGDLLFTRKNTYELVAACALVFETCPKLMLSDLIFRFRLKPGVELNPVYLWGLLTVPSKRRQVQAFAGGSAGSMPNISKRWLLTLPIEVPPLSLQKEFAARVFEIRAMETEQAASRHRLDKLFQSMLHRAFNGEL